MIFWICVVGLLIGVALLIVSTKEWDSYKHHFLYYHDDEIGAIGVGLTVVMAIVVLLWDYLFL